MMTPERIAELRKLLAAGTPGPWRCIVGLIEYDGENVAIHKENAALIVAAVNSLDDMLTEIEHLRSELRR